MTTFLDLTEQLKNYAEQSNLVYQEDIKFLKNRTVAISGNYFIRKILSKQTGNLISGFSHSSIKKNIKKFKSDFSRNKTRFKIVFDGVDIISTTHNFKNQTSLFSKLYHMQWKLEVFKCLHEGQSTPSEFETFCKNVDKISDLIQGSELWSKELLYKMSEFVMNIIADNDIEYVIAPQDAKRQLLWFYENDYCDCILGDYSILHFAEQLGHVMVDIDFENGVFSYFDAKEICECLGLVNPEGGYLIHELWSFYNPYFRENEVTILKSLGANIKDFQKDYLKNVQKRGEIFMAHVQRICDVYQQKYEEQPKKGQFEKMMKSGGFDLTKRDKAGVLLDLRQVITSECTEYTTYPNFLKLQINRKEKERSMVSIDFKYSNQLYAYLSFDVIDKSILTAAVKSTNYSYRIYPPSSDSEEYRGLIETYFKPHLEDILAEFVSTYSKIFLIHTYSLDAYFFKQPTKLDIKNKAKVISNQRNVFYFCESAIKEWEKDTSEKAKSSFINMLTVFFHLLRAAPESGKIKLTRLYKIDNLDDKEDDESVGTGQEDVEEVEKRKMMTDREIICFIILNLLDTIDYISIENKKFMILGAALMRKGSDIFEDKTIILLELVKQGILNGAFMNPPERKLLKSKVTRDDSYLMNSLRKTSEEIRSRNIASPQKSIEEISDSLSRTRKDSEFLMMKDNELSRELTIYDYEKTVNIISREITMIKNGFYGFLESNKIMLDKQVDILNSGIYDPHVAKILLISRVFLVIHSEVEFTEKNRPLVDFDTSQFESILYMIQKILRLKTESLFYAAITRGCENIELSDVMRIKNSLPFRTGFSSHCSNLVKIILTRYVCIKQIKQVCPPEYENMLDSSFNLKSLEIEFSQYSNLKKDLVAGFQFFLNLVTILDYGMERGIDKGSSPISRLFVESRVLLEECFTALGVLG